MGLAATGDGGEVEHGIRVRGRIVACVVAEWAFDARLAGHHVALQHDLRVRRHLQVHRGALHDLHALLADNTRDCQLVQPGRQRRRSRPQRRGVAAQRDGHVQALSSHVLGRPLVVRAHLVRLPVHPRRLPVVDLHPVGAHVASAGLRVARNDERQRDEAPGVHGPALQDWKRVEIGLAAGEHDLLARGIADQLGLRAGDLRQVDERSRLVHQPLRRPLRERQELAHAVAKLVEMLHAQRPRDAPNRAVRVDEHGHVEALHVLEEEGRAAPLDHPVVDLGDLEVAADGRLDARQLAALLQECDELAYVLEFHGFSF